MLPGTSENTGWISAVEVLPYMEVQGDTKAPGVCCDRNAAPPGFVQVTMQCQTCANVCIVCIEHQSVEPTVPCLIF